MGWPVSAGLLIHVVITAVQVLLRKSGYFVGDVGMAGGLFPIFATDHFSYPGLPAGQGGDGRAPTGQSSSDQSLKFRSQLLEVLGT